ncbi:MAG: TonB-dependent receptor [Ginsengibacter sp.]
MILTVSCQNNNGAISLRTKTWMVMKLTIAFLLFFTFQVSATGHAQKITIVKKNASLTEVFKIIERQTNYLFFYDKAVIQKTTPVDIAIRNATLEQTLSVCLKDQGLTYSIVKNTVVIRPEAIAAYFKAQAILTPMKAPEPPPVEIHGKVINNEGVPLQGASVLVAGTKNGTTTNSDGQFTLSVPNGENIVLEISSVGYQTKRVNVGKQTEINVTLELGVSGLSDVVVVGYGTQKKISVTGAVATVDAAQLRVSPAANLGSRLQGRVSGVTVTDDASPGGVPQIRIRGYGSVNNNDPLYVLDGVPLVGNLDDINPDNIQSISILKDASSSAIYGSRASNGVVIITTKHGTIGAPKATFSARYGIQNWKDKINLLSPQESADMSWLQFKNDGFQVGDVGWGNTTYGFGATPRLPDYYLPTGKMEGEVDESLYSWPTPYFGIAKANKQGTDWFNEIRNPNAPTQEYNLSLSNGSEKGSYSFSVGHLNQEGSVIYTNYLRNSLALNADVKMNKWLKVGENLSVAYSKRVGFSNENDLNPIAMAERTSKLSPVYDIMGNFVTGYQPLALLTRAKDNDVKRLRLIGNTYAQIDIMEDLSFKSLLGVEYNTIRNTNYALRMFESQDVAAADKLTEGYSGMLQYNWANTLNYNVSLFKDHNINLLVGSESVSYNSDYLSGGRSTYPFTNLDYMILDAGEKDQVNTGGFDKRFTFSYFTRLNYDYKGKYLLEAVVRRDGSSRFDASHRWGTFPALSAGWRISDESFLKDNVNWINSLKLRVGYGQNGNDNVGNYNAYSTFRSNGSESYYNIVGASSNSSAAGFHQYRLGNPNAKWESSKTTDIGLDAILFNNKFEVNFDYYKRITSDMLYPDPKPATWGQLVFPSKNVGEISNKGYDVTLIYHGKIGNDLKLNIRAIGSHYVNKVIKLNDNPKEILYGPQLRQEVFTASYAGVPISSFYGLVAEGFFNVPKDITDHAPYKASTTGTDSYSALGKIMYKDVNGDGLVNSGDRTIIGNPHPKLTYGLNIDLQYKSFDLSIFSKGVYGVDILNFRKWGLFSGISTREDLYESWTQDRYNGGVKITRPIVTRDFVEMHRPSSFFVEDGSYFRIGSVVLGYSLPSQLLSKIQIKGLRFYVQVTNPITITKYSGLDPELPNNDLLLGVDNSTYPVQHNTMIGIDLNF